MAQQWQTLWWTGLGYLFLSSHSPETWCLQEGECLSAYPDNLHTNHAWIITQEPSPTKGNCSKRGVDQYHRPGGNSTIPLWDTRWSYFIRATVCFSCHDLLLIWPYLVLKFTYRSSKPCHRWRAVQSNSWPLRQRCHKCQSWAFLVLPGTIPYWGIKKQHLKICQQSKSAFFQLYLRSLFFSHRLN